MKVIRQRLAALLLAVAVFAAWAVPACAAAKSDDALLQLNVMFVIDGSGSLVSSNNGTDRSGLRYDAIELFLALLANKGNNVGAIVFDDSPDLILNSGIDEIEGKQQKLALAEQIRDAGTGGDTDIGGALLKAVEQLSEKQAQNGQQSVVILFSDGRTDLAGDEKAYEASLENKDAAIEKAQENNIPIYTVCLAASQVANPEELEEIASRTDGQSVTITSAEELSDVFEEFYQLIFSTSSSQQENRTFGTDGTLELDLQVPSYGAAEINVIVDTDGSALETSITSPSGAISPEEVEDMDMIAGDYHIIKITEPEAGQWNVLLHSDPGKTVRVNVIYNVDVSAELTLNSESNSLGENVPFQTRVTLHRDHEQVTDTDVLREYTAELVLKDSTTGKSETLPMQVDGDAFTADVQGLAKGSYTAQAALQSGGVALSSNSIMLYVANTPPSVVDSENADGLTVKKIVTPLTGRKYTADLSKIFADEQDSGLEYSIANSQLVPDTATIDGTQLVVNTAKSRSGDLVVRATDSDGAYCDYTIHFKITNLTIPIIVLIVGGIVAACIISFVTWRLTRPTYKGILTVVDVNADYGEIGIQHGAFKGKLKLSSFGIGAGNGFNGKETYFVPQRGGQFVRLISSKPFYVDGRQTTEYDIFSEAEIYADEDGTMGFRVVLGDVNEY